MNLPVLKTEPWVVTLQMPSLIQYDPQEDVVMTVNVLKATSVLPSSGAEDYSNTRVIKKQYYLTIFRVAVLCWFTGSAVNSAG